MPDFERHERRLRQGVVGHVGITKLDFEGNEKAINKRNLEEVAEEVANRSDRLATRIAHFSSQFGIPESAFWRDLDTNPSGPLASTLAKEARRQNIHEKAAAEYIENLPHVDYFRKLPASGRKAMYLTSDGQVTSGSELGLATPPSKSIDFEWRTGKILCYAAQKYTKEGGGNQDNQHIELETLLTNFQRRRNNDTALFVLVDGPYYTPSRLTRLQGLVRLQSPFSYVTSVNNLLKFLERMV